LTDKLFDHITECGIPGIGNIPFGIHLCHFYPERQDLVDSLVPYFMAGLRNSERCLWIAAPPLPADEARAELAKVLPRLEAMIQEDRIRIVEATEWFKSIKRVDADDVSNRWLQEEEKALAEGYRGLRITANTSFLTPEDWDTFMDCESAINKAVKGRRIVALCSYDVRQCRATGVLEVIQNHQVTLDRQDRDWEVLRRT
jgi:hypothetical protein